MYAETEATVGDFDIEFAYDAKCSIEFCSEQPCYHVGTEEGGFHVCLHHLNTLGRELSVFCNATFSHGKRAK